MWLAAKNNQLEAVAVLLKYEANPFFDNKEGKKPAEVATDPAVKKLIVDYMEKHSELCTLNFFKCTILKNVKTEIVNILLKKDK